MPREQTIFSYTYEDLAELTGLSVNSVVQARSRREFDPLDIGSVFVWLGRKGTKELRMAMHEFGFYDCQDNPWTKVPHRPQVTKKKVKAEE